MAATRIMLLHIGRAISVIIDYAENPEKTNGDRLITSFVCSGRSASAA